MRKNSTSVIFQFVTDPNYISIEDHNALSQTFVLIVLEVCCWSSQLWGPHIVPASSALPNERSAGPQGGGGVDNGSGSGVDNGSGSGVGERTALRRNKAGGGYIKAVRREEL